jgi:hypothetical protein
MPECRVSSYDNGELPRPPYRERGSFDTADQALMCAHEIITMAPINSDATVTAIALNIRFGAWGETVGATCVVAAARDGGRAPAS